MKFMDFFSATSDASMMRLGFFLCIVTGCVGCVGVAVLDVIYNKGVNIIAVATLVAAFLGPAFYGKQAQAKTENAIVSK